MQPAILQTDRFPHFQTKSSPPATWPDVDPLGADHIDDVPIVTSERRLRRLAIVAADTGARFVREAIDHDPVAWLCSPRAIFDGANAIGACQDRDPFMRAVLLHGLGLGLDADPAEVDDLLDDEHEFPCDLDLKPPPHNDRNFALALYTSFVEGFVGIGDRCVQAFCASVVPNEAAMRRRLAARFGEHLADAAIVHEGIDLNHPLAEMMVPDGLLRVLAMAERDPAGEFAQQLDVVLEQRFAA